jgi:hypothetical protein
MIIFLNKKVCYELLYSVTTFSNSQGRLTFVFAIIHTFNDSHSHHCSHIKIVQAEKKYKRPKSPLITKSKLAKNQKALLDGKA